MDDKWFKQKQKESGVTALDIAQRMGRDRSAVSHILNGKQRMSIEWAQAFADVLQVPVDVVLEKAGVYDAGTAQKAAPGFSANDAAVWKGKPDDSVASVASALGKKSGVDVWQVNSDALSFMGYMPGDLMLVDTHASELARQGDIVVAQVYDRAGATTVLRRLEPPVLVSSGPNPRDHQVHVVDGVNVVIMGKVVASWRK
ncbi:MAG: helix-turn-helix domain-containing protein [Pseudomonadota bacterium]